MQVPPFLLCSQEGGLLGTNKDVAIIRLQVKIAVVVVVVVGATAVAAGAASGAVAISKWQ